MRLFVAVHPPPEVSETLHRAARRLPVAGEVRWIPPGNIHLTLKFLGDVHEQNLKGIEKALSAIRRRHRPFDAALSGFGAFPSKRKARVLWAGFGEGSEHLHELARDIESVLGPLGFERERRAFTPHATIGRARGRPVVLEEAGETQAIPHFEIRHLDLMRSTLKEDDATYSKLSTYPLGD